MQYTNNVQWQHLQSHHLSIPRVVPVATQRSNSQLRSQRSDPIPRLSLPAIHRAQPVFLQRSILRYRRSARSIHIHLPLHGQQVSRVPRRTPESRRTQVILLHHRHQRQLPVDGRLRAHPRELVQARHRRRVHHPILPHRSPRCCLGVSSIPQHRR